MCFYLLSNTSLNPIVYWHHIRSIFLLSPSRFYSVYFLLIVWSHRNTWLIDWYHFTQGWYQASGYFIDFSLKSILFSMFLLWYITHGSLGSVHSLHYRVIEGFTRPSFYQWLAIWSILILIVLQLPLRNPSFIDTHRTLHIILLVQI